MMRRAPPLPADSADEVEARFYQALQAGNLDALMALWADDDEIVCVHPGGGRAIGAAAIRATFAAIFEAGGGVAARPEQMHRLSLPGAELHHLIERITVGGPQGPQEAWVLASNVYVKTLLGWRMAAHHASPGQPEELSMQGADASATTLH